MTWDIEAFIKEAESAFDQAPHNQYVESSLPNKGDSLDEICNKGFAQLQKNGDKLLGGMLEDIARKSA